MIEIATTVATIRAIAGVAKAAGKIDLYSEILDLQGTLFELSAQNAALLQENLEIRREFAELKQKVQDREQMTAESNVYWRTANDGRRDGPFCPTCLDGSEKAVRLIERTDDHWWRCPVCDKIVQKPGRDPDSRPARTDYDLFDSGF